MKVVESRKVRQVLKEMGFVEVHGDGTDHAIFANDQGLRLRPKLVNRDMHLRTLQCLRRQLDAQGLDGRRFWLAVRAA